VPPTPVRAREEQAATTPAVALRTLKEGNARFVAGRGLERDLLDQVRQTSKAQFPLAAIVSCIDSRVLPETVFDQGIGDLFVARVAGNFVNDDILGSLEYATKVAGAKLIVVMGHSGCGAVKGACDGVELGLLTGTLAKIMPALDAVQGDYTPRDSSNPEFVEAVAEMNVRMTLSQLRERSAVQRELIDRNEIGLVGAMYDVRSGVVAFLD
jgi:carbonic anhydrase